MHRRSATAALVRDVLKDDYLGLDIDRIEVVEDVAAGAHSAVKVTLRETGATARTQVIDGQGSGIVDALYHGLVAHYAPEYPSLGTIKFTGFGVTGRMDTGRQSGLDAEAEVSLSVANTHEHTFEFAARDRSLVAAALRVVTEAAEYFINSERAYIAVYRAFTDARQRGRQDLVQRYTHQLAQLVDTTSYSEVIERIRAETSAEASR